MPIRPYLDFDGACDDAIAFYQRALGAKVNMLMRVKESPEPPPPGMMAPGSENKVMHAELAFHDAVMLLSDGRGMNQRKFSGVMLPRSTRSTASPKAAR
jgi:PhnB protein